MTALEVLELGRRLGVEIRPDPDDRTSAGWVFTTTSPVDPPEFEVFRELFTAEMASEVRTLLDIEADIELFGAVDDDEGGRGV